MAAEADRPGRPRDAGIDRAILVATRDQLASRGYEGMSVAVIAKEAGTTRPAIYRRWSSKAELAVAAIADMSTAHQRQETDDPRADLIEELAAFRRGVLRPNGLGMIGAMFQATTDEQLVTEFRECIVLPRRTRIRRILDRASEAGMLAPDADLDYAVAACTGILYALVLAERPIGRDWAERTADFVWRGAGGSTGQEPGPA